MFSCLHSSAEVNCQSWAPSWLVLLPLYWSSLEILAILAVAQHDATRVLAQVAQVCCCFQSNKTDAAQCWSEICYLLLLPAVVCPVCDVFCSFLWQVKLFCVFSLQFVELWLCLQKTDYLWCWCAMWRFFVTHVKVCCSCTCRSSTNCLTIWELLNLLSATLGWWYLFALCEPLRKTIDIKAPLTV